MHIYISSTGGKLGSSVEVFNKLTMVDKAYVIVDQDRKHGSKNIIKFFEECRVPCELIVVNGKQDFRGIVDAVRQIVEENRSNKKVRYSMDITGGTSLMSAALCYSAFFIGAETYYVMYDKDKEGAEQAPLEERLVKLPTANVPDVKNMGKQTRKVLNCIFDYYGDGRTQNDEFSLTHRELEELTKMSSSRLGYHLGVLKRNNVICTEEGKYTRIALTEEGRMLKGWLDII